MNNNDYLEYRKKALEQRIEREQQGAKADIKIIKRDFFDSLPEAVVEVLRSMSYRWKRYDWFEEAWNKYRDHVLDATSKNLPIKAPGYIFNEYIDEQIKEDFLKVDELDRVDCECCDRPLAYSDKDLNELFHHGVKGQKWGVRRYQNQDGTLTEEGKSRYGSQSDANKNSTEEEKLIDKLKKENELNKVVDTYNERIDKQNLALAKAKEKDFNDSINMVKEGRNITSELSIIARDPKKGSNRSNPKETKFEIPGPYAKMSDDELRKIVNRMQLERQFGDLSGDAKYTLTGREKTREYLQTIGAILGIGVSALTIYKIIQSRNK